MVIFFFFLLLQLINCFKVSLIVYLVFFFVFFFNFDLQMITCFKISLIVYLSFYILGILLIYVGYRYVIVRVTYIFCLQTLQIYNIFYKFLSKFAFAGNTHIQKHIQTSVHVFVQ